MTTRERILALSLFFLSGACGLVYQVVWVRMMTHVFGTTALAVGTVLAAFMSGLALGSWSLGRLADRSPNPLRLYAFLELGVAAAALAAHFLLARLTPAYMAIYEVLGRSDSALAIARFSLAFGLVLAPTVLMGATLPVLSRFVVQRLSGLTAGLAGLYSINIAGAVAGTLLAGFHLIGAYGLHITVLVAVLGNTLIGVAAWVASLGSGPEEGERLPDEEVRTEVVVGRGTYRLLLFGLALSGLTSFAYEIYWSRSLVFLLGSSTYALSTMLTAFLTGLAVGGFLARFLVDRVRDRVALFGWIQVAIGATAAAALPVLFALAGPERIRIHVLEAVHDGASVALWRFGVSFAVMLVPATLIGATFPLMGRIGVSDLSTAGATVGRVYAVNTAGNVAGALLPGLLLLPLFGIQRGILGMAVLNGAVGFAVVFARLRVSRRARWVVPSAVVGTALVLAQVPLGFQFPSESQTPRQRVLFYREGPSATTAVLYDPENGQRSMSVDGIDIGGSSFTEYKQLLLAHLPKLLLDDVSTELSIGLGSGILAGESAQHARVKAITCVEIEPGVVEGAAFFGRENHGVLDDPRVRVVVDDVANHLRTSADRYRVISADEKTSQEYASNGFSYSREYYRLLLGRLAPGGVVVQWVPTTLPPPQYTMVLRTFADAFPHAQLWYFMPALKDGAVNTLLVGSRERIPRVADDVARRLDADRDAFASLTRYGLTGPEAVLAQFVAEDEVLRRAVAHAPENSLTHPRYEFYSPADYAVSRSERHRINHELLTALRRSGDSGGRAGRLEDAFAAEDLYLSGFHVVLAGGTAAEALQLFEQSLERAPWNDSLRARVHLAYLEIGLLQAAMGERQTALGLLERAVNVFGRSARARVAYGESLLASGRVDLALEQARAAVELQPGLLPAHRLTAAALLRLGRGEEAAVHLRRVLQAEPGDAWARSALSGL